VKGTEKILKGPEDGGGSGTSFLGAR
jgi:hypothetical protein